LIQLTNDEDDVEDEDEDDDDDDDEVLMKSIGRFNACSNQLKAD